MKKTLALIGLAISLAANAAVLTVNNNTNLPGNPGQYTTITDAISAASTGDTILVAGSATIYASFNLNKKLTLIGAGYNPDKQNPLASTVSSITINAFNTGGSTIMGFKTSIIFASGTTYNNITIRRCNLAGFSILDSTNNLLVAENIVTGQFYFGTGKGQLNCKITNNIFNLKTMNYGLYQNTGSYSNITPVTIDHNLFIAGDKNTPLVSSNWFTAFYTNVNSNYERNFIISNNIFYNVDPSQPNTYGNFTFNNNISFSGGVLPTLPSTGSIGGGNLNNTDPQLVSIFNTTNTLDYNLDNLRLKTTSPAKNGATDGTDIGPTGGQYPIYRSTNQYLTGEPTIPEVKLANFIGTSSIAVGGTLHIQVKAKKID